MRADIRNGKDATIRRTQPNWLVECIKLGIPLMALPTPPAADATFADKSRYTWALRKLWEQRTGRQIERLTPQGYNEKMLEKRKKQRRR
ncbi:hypothetical protein [Phyllobacterium sp. P5_D12]